MNDESGWSARRGTRAAGLGPLVLGPESLVIATPSDNADDGDGREAAWAALRPLTLDARQSDRGRLISYSRRDPAHAVIDMLRTRVAQAMDENGWSRIAVTSPTKGCGKTFLSANLALSLARGRGRRVGLVDMDLRLPGLARAFGVREPGGLDRFLRGVAPIGEHFRRVGDNLAVGFNDVRLHDPAVLLRDPSTAAALALLRGALGLGVVIYDLPPMLACDDFLALLPETDCVILVAGGGITRAAEITRCAKLIEGRKPLLGVVLNQADDPEVERYYY